MRHVIATPSQTKAILQRHGMTAKKSYGQNFLIDAGIVEKIARSAVVSDHCAVIEIGPGIGALTQFLCEYAAKVIAFEIDERLPAVLADTLGEYDNVELVMEDFLQTDLSARQLGNFTGDVKIIGNLPYYITTPILFKIFESEADIAAITVMMQREVADRFHAECGSKDYNALSVVTQYRCSVKQVVKVPRNVFMPRPNVDSTVLQVRFRERPQLDEAAFSAMVRACFAQRRKTILNNFASICGGKDAAAALLQKAGIDPGVRSEQLELSAFLNLFEVYEHENRSECEDQSVA